MHNVAAEKRATYFALEAERREIERRLKYRNLVQLAHASGLGSRVSRMSYRDWYDCKYEWLTDELGADAESAVAAQSAGLHTYYRRKSFTVADIEKLFTAVQSQTDLIVLDHLLDVDLADDNEHKGFKAVVKGIRDIALDIGVPIVVVAHLRKKDRGRVTLVPTLDDFHGTSAPVLSAVLEQRLRLRGYQHDAISA